MKTNHEENQAFLNLMSKCILETQLQDCPEQDGERVHYGLNGQVDLSRDLRRVN